MDSNKKAIVDQSALDLFEHECPMVRTHSYPFSWGLLSESVSEEVKEEMGLPCVEFEFAARDVSLAFPGRWHLVDLFTWMYYWHPLRHRIIVPNEEGIIFNMSVISFRAKGEHEVKTLRAWLVKVYIPLIWPDLLREAMRIVTEKKASLTSPQSLDELIADRARYLGEDPKSLSFYKANMQIR